jgi:SulP family sulfate permease
MIALVEGYRAGLYARHQWLPNIIAGLVVGIVALPLSMAFAIASGARPEQGIYTAIIGGGLVTLLGGSRVQVAGPTGAFIVILAGITAKYGMAGLQVATLMAGVMLLLMGLTKMGGVIKFIPAPVIIGFTTGIGVIIFVGQWSDFSGLPKVSAEHFHEKLWGQLLLIPQTRLTTLAIALLSLLIVIFSPKIAALKKIPGPLIAMIVATLLQSTLHLSDVATIGTAFGGVPQGLPVFAVPDLSVSQVLSLIGPAFTIAMLGAIESLLSAVVADGMADTKHDSNQELVGQGIANMLTPLFGGFAATGAIARTATNIRNGATSPLAGVMHAVTLIAVLLILAPLASSIPLAALAAILFVVAWNMSELHRFGRVLLRAPYADRAILVVTFLLTVFVDLVVAVNVGVILAILHFLRRMSAAVELRQLDDVSVKSELASLGLASLPAGTLLYELNGPMFFGAVDNFERVLHETATDPKILIMRLQRVPFIDVTGLQCLEDSISGLQKRGVRVLLCEANERVLLKMRKAGLFESLPEGHYFQSLSGALLAASE